MPRKSAVEIFYSRNEKLYYIAHPFFRSTDWLSVEEHDLPIPEAKKTGMFSGALGISKKDGRVYWRDMYGFAFYEIKSGRIEPISEDTDLFKDYASAMHWPMPKTPEFRAEASKLIESHRERAKDAQETVDYHNAQIAALKAASHAV